MQQLLDIQDKVFFSRDRIEFEKMNVLYNITDFCINTSYAEGFGLSTLEAMMTGTPIIAPKTGGLTRQVENYKDGTHNGVALEIDFKTIVGSQSVPYIYEDYVHNENFADAMMKIYKMSKKERQTLSRRVEQYAKEEFSHQKTIDSWDESMKSTILNFKNRKNWQIEEI